MFIIIIKYILYICLGKFTYTRAHIHTHVHSFKDVFLFVLQIIRTYIYVVNNYLNNK
jgi:hypothetical protein